MFTVYKITNMVNDKIYVGVHKTESIYDDYYGSSKYLNLDIKKYGIQNFLKDIVAISDNEKEAFQVEAEIVNSVFVKREDTYNKQVGGKGSLIKSDEHKQKIRDAKLGTKLSSETKEKISESTSGKNNPKATRIGIFDSDDNLVAESFGNFKEICISNDFPFSSFRKNLKQDHRLYENTNKISEVNKKFKNFNITYL